MLRLQLTIVNQSRFLHAKLGLPITGVQSRTPSTSN